MVKLILFSMLGFTLPTVAAPITLISPKQVSAGYTISTTGNYLLADDVFSNVSAITITNSNVVLDLNNKTLSSASAVATGITVNAGVGNITIRNGAIIGFGTPLSVGSNTSDIVLDGISAIDGSGGSSNILIGSSNIQRVTIRNCTTGGGVVTPAGVTLSGVAVGAISDCSLNGIQLSSCTDVVLSRVFTSNNQGHGIGITSCTDIVLSDVHSSSNNGSGMVTNSGTDIVVRDSLFTQNAIDGLTMLNSTGIVVRDSLVAQNTIIGVSFVSTSSSVIMNCISRGNGSIGFSIANTSGGVVVRGSSAYNNTGIGFVNNAGSSILLGNLAFGNSSNYAGTGPAAFVQVNNGGQLPPGSVVDPQVDNISMV